MCKRMLFVSLIVAASLIQAAPASACPAGYRPCGDFCCAA
jgi:hypothetical protein